MAVGQTKRRLDSNRTFHPQHHPLGCLPGQIRWLECESGVEKTPFRFLLPFEAFESAPSFRAVLAYLVTCVARVVVLCCACLGSDLLTQTKMRPGPCAWACMNRSLGSGGSHMDALNNPTADVHGS